MKLEIRKKLNIGNLGMSIIFISMVLSWINYETNWTHPLVFLVCMIGGGSLVFGDLTTF